jgi:hypothetical protein
MQPAGPMCLRLGMHPPGSCLFPLSTFDHEAQRQIIGFRSCLVPSENGRNDPVSSSE